MRGPAVNVEEVKDVVMSRATSKFMSANGCRHTAFENSQPKLRTN